MVSTVCFFVTAVKLRIVKQTIFFIGTKRLTRFGVRVKNLEYLKVKTALDFLQTLFEH